MPERLQPTIVFAKAGLENVTSAMCNYQLRFGLDVQFSALVHNFNNIKKLTKELHEFYDWSLSKGENRIYFRTLEDKNKDEELNNKDKFHYYFIAFSGDKYSVTEYNHLKIFE